MVQEGVGIAHCASQDTANHIAGFLVARQLPVGDSEGDGADMVCHHAHGDVGLLLFAVLAAAYLADTTKHRLEDIGVVVALLALQGAHQALEAHAGVNHLLRQPL